MFVVTLDTAVRSQDSALLKQSLSSATAVCFSYKTPFVCQYSSVFILNNLAPPCHTSLLLQMPTLTTVVATLRSLRTTRLSRFPRSVAGTRSRLHRRRKADLSLPLSVLCNHLVKQCLIARAVAKFSHPALTSPPILSDVAQRSS